MKEFKRKCRHMSQFMMINHFKKYGQKAHVEIKIKNKLIFVFIITYVQPIGVSAINDYKLTMQSHINENVTNTRYGDLFEGLLDVFDRIKIECHLYCKKYGETIDELEIYHYFAKPE